MSTLKKGQRLIFIGGAPRSGTTLVQNILDSHPAICGGPEFLHIRDILGLRKKLHRSIDREFIDLICSPDDVDRSIGSFIEDLLLPLADKNGCKFLSEKTPENVLVFPELISLFSESHFIHVVRDPRATISSLLQVQMRTKNKGEKPPKHVTNIHNAVRHTKECFSSGFLAAKIAPERVLTVVYEQLIADSKRETERICEFLELEWSSNMITPGKFEHLGEKAITAKSSVAWYNTQAYNRDPDTQSLEKWKTLLTPTQKALIATLFKDYADLNQIGYDFSIHDIFFLRRFLSVIYITFTRLLNQVSDRLASAKAIIQGH